MEILIKKILAAIRHYNGLILISIAIIGLAFSVISYITTDNSQKQRESQNQKILIENAKKEIEDNLLLFDWIEKNRKEFEEQNSYPISRFSVKYIEIITSFYYEKKDREIMIATIYDLKQLNSILDEIKGIQTNSLQDLLNQKKEKVEKFFNISTNARNNLRYLGQVITN